jgi:aminoglycoside phosphotransferase (APT) family kinase protein
VWRLRHQEATGPYALLEHFADVGCALTPRYLGRSPDGHRDRYGYLPGDTGYPPYTDEVRSARALTSLAEAVRQVHDASAGFSGPPDLTWARAEVSAPVTVDCIGHGDLTPWNTVFRGAEVVGIIDWDTAAPSNRVWDLSYAAFQFVPLHADAGLRAWGWTAPPDRRARLRELLAAYGAGVTAGEVLDACAVRLAGMAAFMEAAVRRGDERYRVHLADGHAAAYRAAAAHVLALDRARL